MVIRLLIQGAHRKSLSRFFGVKLCSCSRCKQSRYAFLWAHIPQHLLSPQFVCQFKDEIACVCFGFLSLCDGERLWKRRNGWNKQKSSSFAAQGHKLLLPIMIITKLVLFTYASGGANVDVTYKEISCLTPLECAVSKGQTDVIEMLLSAECSRPSNFYIDEHVHDKVPKEHISLIKEHFSQPLSLKRSCRKVVRSKLGLGGNYTRKLDQLALPKPLQRFLQYEEINHYGQCPFSKKEVGVDPRSGFTENEI